MDDLRHDTLDAKAVLGWSEIGCWAALAMTPIIWWLHGPSVSTHQFAVRRALMTLSGSGGLGLRIYAL